MFRSKIAKTSLMALVIAFPTFTYGYHRVQKKIIIDRFPHLDPERVGKAYNTIFFNALCGKYNDQELTDEFLDKLLLSYYHGYGGLIVP